MQEYTVKVYGDRTEWLQNGKFHRLDAPAIEYKNGAKYWYKNGRFHRLDGPAMEYSDGRVEYWENGVLIPNPNETKEMTVAEISAKLGYNVKVIKG